MTLPRFDTNQLNQLILQRLPILMRQNQQIQELVLELARENFASRQETNDRFYQLLNELKRDRENKHESGRNKLANGTSKTANGKSSRNLPKSKTASGMKLNKNFNEYTKPS